MVSPYLAAACQLVVALSSFTGMPFVSLSIGMFKDPQSGSTCGTAARSLVTPAPMFGKWS